MPDLALRASHGRLHLDLDGHTLLRDVMPTLTWRHPGEVEWRQATAEVPEFAIGQDRIGLACRLGPLAVSLDAVRCADHAWELTARIDHAGDAAVELSRLQYLDGVLVGAGRGLHAYGEVAAVGTDHYASDQPVAPFRQRFTAFWGTMGVQWPMRPDPIHDQADWAIGQELAVLEGEDGAADLLIGFIAPAEAWGEVGVRTCRRDPACHLGVLLDNILLQPGDGRGLERCLLWAGDRHAGMAHWARACATAHGSRVAPPLVGWCSWYQHWCGVRAADVLSATEAFAAWPVPPGGRTVQIDDGFQVMPGDWRPNGRFAAVWDGLPERIAASGSLPGLWLAPTAIFHRHPIVREHPGWLQRLPDGSPAVMFSNWGWCDGPDQPAGASPTWFLDPDHPGARAFMAGIIRDAVAAGWRYLKIDFTYALSTARVAHDRSRTGLQTLRGLYHLFREAAGPDTLICACIGTMGRYALGHADTARLGGDIGGEWPVIRRNLPQVLDRVCSNGVWWNGDPDVFYMRRQDSHLDREESRLLTGTIGLLGGVYLTSDHPRQWDDDGTALVRRFWNHAGPRIPAAQCVLPGADGFPLAFAVTHADGSHLVGLYNGADEACRTHVRLDRLGLATRSQDGDVSAFAGEGVILADGTLICPAQPRHSLRIARLAGGT